MFHPQIGRNVEVYVDDMLVKSTKEAQHLDNLQETIDTLRRYNMKLNPNKCACTHNFHKRRSTRSQNSVTNNQFVFDLYICEYNPLYESLQ